MANDLFQGIGDETRYDRIEYWRIRDSQEIGVQTLKSVKIVKVKVRFIKKVNVNELDCKNVTLKVYNDADDSYDNRK